MKSRFAPPHYPVKADTKYDLAAQMAGNWELLDSDAPEQSTEDDNSALIGIKRRAPRPIHIKDTSRDAGPRGRSSSPIDLRDTQSEEEYEKDIFSDGEATYLQFKNRKKRKRSAAFKRKSKPAQKSSIVGRRERRIGDDEGPSRKKPRQMKNYGEVSSEDDMMEDTLPEYLRTRRRHFDKRRERLLEAGLKLPPDYDDIDFSDEDHLEDLDERPMFTHIKPCRKYEDIQLPYSLGLIPAPVAQWLRDYQVDGVSFLHELFVYQKGGILGDDMGLGKTVQVIAFLTAAYGKTGDERDAKRMRKMRRKGDDIWYPRTLIICPGTLIQNWRAELERWGWWYVDVFHGSSKEDALQSAMSGRVEILITTYTMYRMNKDALNMVDWDCVIADECHLMKERKSETAKAMHELNSLCRIGLTGTAIQNKYEELWTLLNWTNPGRFGPVSTWKSTIADPLKIGQSHDATVYQLSKARKTAKKLVQNLLPAFFLRRMKTLIADQLPKKSDRVVFCPLTETQADAYENLLNSDIVEYIRTSSDPCPCGSGKKSGWCCHKKVPNGGPWQSYVFPAISNLQKLSNHLAILIPQPTDPNEKQDKDLNMLQIAVPDKWRELYRTRGSILNYSNPEFCGKWKVLKKLLKWWHSNGDKVLVFSHSVRLLKMLQMLFNHTSYNVSYLDGAMSYEERAQVVDDFNANPQQFVFLISTKAGGVGLNITSANKVVVVDPNWNPSHDLQAQDRAYRIGQLRDVEVFRLVSAGTIEEIVYARQIYKQQQANIGYNASIERRYFKGVQEKKDQKGEIFGLHNLFEYQNNNIVLRDIVNKTNVAESKAGVQVVNFEVFDQRNDDNKGPNSDNAGNEDTAMSQLAALVQDGSDAVTQWGEEKKSTTSIRHDPIHAILTSAGVEYTHENSEVIGSSKVEEQLSRRAEMADERGDFGREQVFQESQGDSSSAIFLAPTSLVKFRYHPPEGVMRRQFCSMAKENGFDNATEFALAVEGMTQAERRAFLEQWYKRRREILLGNGEKIS
ncbi:hypothetical protein LOZ61_003894 [Ophidiomyces ophidiicola]|uniref:Uncharacterized protein n=1 Tax=Ophidiomyces ophidiicola TaxID=1387563 RepID=A0ACB8UX69_9EURO|nr:hypothetical protein LOZ61_003894 [Ophidiomyces ophidiicola]KAI1918481.1 hypothetical protein LOZ64_002710 [Ophidiomyces ophidiicola]KAI1926840.1 hypothetical protein LOZ60_003329 [Ophidiomyces ophidiicola]KAI1958757.1 hypothetical protein LOZ59_003319 [Ophidiomyces ophidiicola]KAI2009080.1 hypothetical protein LOZ50_001727 [Ophidiomyces ophidiicola]